MASYKSRWILVVPADCARDELIFFGSTIRVVRRLSVNPLVLLVENTISTEASIEEAFYVSWEKINLFSIACSLIGYGSSKVLSHVATLPSEYENLDNFDVLIPRVIFNERNECVIGQRELEAMQTALQGPYADAVICVSSALRTQSIEEKSTLMHSGCQEIAKVSGVPTIKQKCSSCDKETDTGRPATNNYIRNIFQENIDDGANLYGQFTELRHKIGHGKPISSLKEHLDAKFVIAGAQGAITHHLDRLLNFNRSIGKQAVTGLPFAIYSFSPSNGSYQAGAKSFKGEMTISQVKGNAGIQYQGYTMEYGIRTDYQVVFDPEFLGLIFGPPINDAQA